MALLSRCLSHLLTFSSIKIEVVIGDNASTDDINDVVTAYERQFTHFSYLRHATDIGLVRNIHSTLSRARAPYAYVLCDDDIVFENGLGLLKAMLDGSPELAASGGKYVSADTPPTVGTNVDYGATTHFCIARGDHLALADNFLLCDGYPLLRTELFRRHCIGHERGFGLLPLFSQLLTYGDIAFIDRPVFQHFQNRESLSTKLPESWFHDFCDADVEIAFARLPEPLPASTLERLRAQFHRITYIQSARMCRIRKDFPLMWDFLIRAKAVGGVSDGCLVRCERMFLLDLILQRICRMIEDAGAKAVWVENTTLMLPLKARLQEMLPEVAFCVSENDADAEASEIYLIENFEQDRATSPDAATVIAFHDVLTAMRLTRHAAEASADRNSIKLDVLAPQSPAPDFEILMADYGRPANKKALVAEDLTSKPLQTFPERSQAPPTLLDNAVGRNRPCPCGSGKRYKHCHGRYA